MEQCRLCLEPKTKLEDSHFLSAGLYRRLRNDKEKNPNPWQLTAKTAVRTSEQMRAPLFCWNCEQRLSKCGENWVLGHCLQRDGSFPLASILASRTPDLSSDKSSTRVYYASKVPEIDIIGIGLLCGEHILAGVNSPLES